MKATRRPSRNTVSLRHCGKIACSHLRSSANAALAKPVVAPVAATVKTPRSKSKEPKKSVDAATAADAAAATTTDAEETPKPERSQSRKRGSIFGTLLGKKEEVAEKKEAKEEKKEEAAATEPAAEPTPAPEATEAAPAAAGKIFAPAE